MDQHFEREQNLKNKIENFENWNKYCENAKLRLEKLKTDFEEKSKIEDERVIRIFENCGFFSTNLKIFEFFKNLGFFQQI